MARVNITTDAQKELQDLPLVIQQRALVVFERLEEWPSVSGAKPLRGNLKGSFRIRTGDYRIVFRVDSKTQTVIVWKIGYRGDVYD